MDRVSRGRRKRATHLVLGDDALAGVGGGCAAMMRERAHAENWVQIPAPSLSSCMTLGVSCNLSARKLLICKMVIIVISNCSLGGLHELA